MAGKTYETNIRIGGQVGKSLGSSIKSANSQLGGLGKSLKGIAAMAAGAFAGIKVAEFAKDAVNTFKDFEQSMANTAAIAGIDRLHDDYAALERAALDAGKATSKTAKDAADALGYMKLAGWETTDVISGLMPVLRLSEASGMELATASDMVTDTMSALGLEVDKVGLGVNGLAGYLDIVAKTQNSANTNAQQLMAAYLGVGGTMKSLRVPMEESAAVLGLMANRGTKGAEAGNSLNSILVNLTAPTGKAADALEKLGYSAFDTQGNFLGLENSLMLLKDKLAGANDEQMQYFTSAIGGKTQLTELQQILDGLGNEYLDLKTTILDNNGALDKMAETMNNTLTGAFYRLDSAVDDFKINMVKQFEPYITPAINKIAEALPNITEGMSKGLANLVDFAKGTAGAIRTNLKLDDIYQSLKPKAAMVQSFAKMYGHTFVDGAARFFKGESLSDAFSDSMSGLNAVLSVGMGEKGSLIFEGIRTGLDRVSGVIETVRSNVGELAGVFQESFGAVSDAVGPAINEIIGAIGSVKADELSALSTVMSGIKDTVVLAAPVISGLITSVIDVIGRFVPVAMEISGSVIQVAGMVVPVLVGMFGEIMNNAGSIIDGIKAFVDALVPVVSGVVDTIMQYLPGILPVFQGLGQSIGNLVMRIGQTLQILAPLFASIFNFICQNIIPVAVVVFKNLGTVVNAVVNVIANVLPIIAAALMAVWQLAQPILQQLMNIFQFAFGFVSGVVSSSVEAIGGFINDVLGVFGGVIDFVTGVFTGNWEKAWQGVQDIFANTFNALSGILKAPLNAVISLINAAIDGINSINVTIPDWVPGMGGKSFGVNIAKMPMLARGTDYFGGGMAIVGEKGPELVNMSRGSQVITSSKTQGLIDTIGRLFDSPPLLSRNQSALQFASGLDPGSVVGMDGGFKLEVHQSFTIEGGASKDDIRRAAKSGVELALPTTQSQFNKLMDGWLKEQKRVKFS